MFARFVHNLVILLALAASLLLTSAAPAVQAQEEGPTIWFPLISTDLDDLHRIEFPEEGFAIQIPQGWTGRIDNSFGPHLPANIVVLGNPNSYDISIVSVALADDFPQDVRGFAETIIGLFRGAIPPTDFDVHSSNSEIANSIRILFQEPDIDQQKVVIVLSEFFLFEKRGYWLSTEFYSRSDSIAPLYPTDIERLHRFEQISKSFTLLDSCVLMSRQI